MPGKNLRPRMSSVNHVQVQYLRTVDVEQQNQAATQMSTA